MTHQLLIIGGGPAGVEAALFAAKHHIEAAIVSEGPVGGRAVWGSLVPSKVWLSETQKTPANFSLEQLRTQVALQSRISSEQTQEKLAAAGVTVYYGKARFSATNTLVIQSEQAPEQSLTAPNIIIATGSEPVFLPELKPQPPRIIAPRLAGKMTELPESMLMIGGGITGVEYAYAYARLGVRITLLQRGAKLLSSFDDDSAAYFERWLSRDLGIQIEKNSPVKSLRVEGELVIAETPDGRQFSAAYGFIAAGRRPDLSFADLTQIPFATASSGALATDIYGQTSLPGIYAIGDAAGSPMTVNQAQMQARIAVMHMLEGEKSTLLPKPLVEAVYTHPPIGQIGNMDASADAEFISLPFDSLLKLRLEGHADGLLKIKINRKSRQIEGASAFGYPALELLSILQLAMHNDIGWEALGALPMPHPSYSELLTQL